MPEATIVPASEKTMITFTGHDNMAADDMSRIPNVVIVGRPNVGKSSLFNLLVGRRKAIVHEESGVTRDRVVSTAKFKGRVFQVADTGGLGLFSSEKKRLGLWDAGIREQVETAIECADLIIFLADVTAGVTPLDKDIANHLRSSGKPFFLAANKADTQESEVMADEFAICGAQENFAISCTHRRGIEKLLEKVLDTIVAPRMEEQDSSRLNIAVVGRPNVGKSSLVNRLLGEKRMIVSDVPGTTRDAVDSPFELRFRGQTLNGTLVDTAGLRKKGRADTAVEVFSIMRAESAIKRADIVLLVIEAENGGVTAQDKKIASMIEASARGCIIIANKFDLSRDMEKTVMMGKLRESLKFLKYAPMVLSSALRDKTFEKLYEQIFALSTQAAMDVPTPLLNKLISDACGKNPPPAAGRRSFKIYYAAMTGNRPPRFMLFVNDPELCTQSFATYIKNTLHERLGIIGWPVLLSFRKKTTKHADESAKD